MIKITKSLLLATVLILLLLAFYPVGYETQLELRLPDLSDQSTPTNRTTRIADTIKKGETLSALLIKNGIATELIHPIAEAFKEIYSVNRLKPGDNYELEIDSVGKLYSLTYSPAIEKRYHLFLNRNQGYSTREVSIDLVPTVKYLQGHIQSTMWDAIIDAGESPELLLSFTDIFQWDIDFFIDPRLGDRFKIVYEKFYMPDTGEFVRYGKVLTAQYIATADTFTAIYFDNSPGDDGYYDLTGSSFQKTFLKSPLNYRRISSHFSYSRRHPILKKYRPHFGIDYAALQGTPVSAAADGVVIDKGYDKGIGNFVKIQHKNAHFITVYGHLSRFGEEITEGIRVKQKQIVGYVGSTGLATGPHLHYAFYENGRPINPLKIDNTSGDPVLPANQSRFEAIRDSRLKQLNGMDQPDMPLVLFPAMQVHYNRYTVPDR